METSLYVDTKVIETLIPIVDSFIVDIKDLNPQIYSSYTGKPIELLMANLKLLASKKVQDKVNVRVPLIPNYNTPTNQKQSVTTLEDMGFNDIELFNYIVPEHG